MIDLVLKTEKEKYNIYTYNHTYSEWMICDFMCWIAKNSIWEHVEVFFDENGNYKNTEKRFLVQNKEELATKVFLGELRKNSMKMLNSENDDTFIIRLKSSKINMVIDIEYCITNNLISFVDYNKLSVDNIQFFIMDSIKRYELWYSEECLYNYLNGYKDCQIVAYSYRLLWNVCSFIEENDEQGFENFYNAHLLWLEKEETSIKMTKDREKLLSMKTELYNLFVNNKEVPHDIKVKLWKSVNWIKD